MGTKSINYLTSEVCTIQRRKRTTSSLRPLEREHGHPHTAHPSGPALTADHRLRIAVESVTVGLENDTQTLSHRQKLRYSNYV